MNAPDPAHALRDPQPLLDRFRSQWRGGCCGESALTRPAREAVGARADDLWVFGYASLIWRPEFEASERRAAVVHGFHRALAMRSWEHRGTPEVPGLVFALVSGGSCRGMAYRISRHDGDATLDRLWAREMCGGLYEPRWLRCRTTAGTVHALGFTLARHSPFYTGALGDDEVIDVLRTARGQRGTTLDYLVDTARSLRECGIRDRDVERLVALAQRNALV